MSHSFQKNLHDIESNMHFQNNTLNSNFSIEYSNQNNLMYGLGSDPSQITGNYFYNFINNKNKQVLKPTSGRDNTPSNLMRVLDFDTNTEIKERNTQITFQKR